MQKTPNGKGFAQLVNELVEQGQSNPSQQQQVEELSQRCARQVNRLEKRLREVKLEERAASKSTKPKKKGKEEKNNPWQKLGEKMLRQMDKAVGRNGAKSDIPWVYQGTKKGAEIFLGKQEGQRLNFFKGVAEIDAPYADLLAAFTTRSEFDEIRFATDPMFLGSEFLEAWGEDKLTTEHPQHAAVVLAQYKFPAGITNREFLLYLQDVILDERSAYDIAISVEYPHEVSKGFIRGEIKASGSYLEDLGNNRCRLTYLAQADLKGWIPTSFINMTLKGQAKNVIRTKEHLEKLYKAKAKKSKSKQGKEK